MPLESGDQHFARPWGKASSHLTMPNLSGTRYGPTTEGEDRSDV